MPAMGELLCKIREKRPGDYRDSVDELFKLIDSGFIDVRYISNADDVFGMAKAIVSKRCDPRDRISPMDALIIATAAANQDCEVFYSADSKLIADVDTHNIVNDCRKGLGFDSMRVNDISDILKV